MCGFVVDRKSIEVYEQHLYEKLQKYDVWSRPIKLVGFVVDRKNIDLYCKHSSFAVDRESID